MWLHDGTALSWIIMRIEAAKFDKMRMEAQASRLMERLRKVRSAVVQLERNLEFLSSSRARVILLIEYRHVRKSLAALRHEEAVLRYGLSRCEDEHEKITNEINDLYAQAEAAACKVLRFRRRAEEDQG